MKYRQKDSNFHLTDFKSVASACWAMAASTPGRIRTFSILLLRQARLPFHHGSKRAVKRIRTFILMVRSHPIFHLIYNCHKSTWRGVIPVSLLSELLPLVWVAGFEPACSSFQGRLDKPDSYTPRYKNKKAPLLAGLVKSNAFFSYTRTIFSLLNFFSKGRSNCFALIMGQI